MREHGALLPNILHDYLGKDDRKMSWTGNRSERTEIPGVPESEV